MKKYRVPICCGIFFVGKAVVDGLLAYNTGLRSDDIAEKIFSGAILSIFLIVLFLVGDWLYKRNNR